MTKEQEMQDMLFETVQLETPSNTDTSVTDVIASDAPSMTDPKWNDYVMSMFTEKEMYNGNPLVNGLRRVAEVVLGPIVYSGPTPVFPPPVQSSSALAPIAMQPPLVDSVLSALYPSATF